MGRDGSVVVPSPVKTATAAARSEYARIVRVNTHTVPYSTHNIIM